MANNDSFQGVSTCYVFKSRLQEYAQKVGLPTPVYETIKEGPSHEPTFRSTVTVKDVRYDSLPGFFNRKAAEQSAAEVALMKMESLSQPVHETGLCKNLLQEYAQKMNFAIPQYECRRYDTDGKVISFSCTVEVGGMRYIGAAARTKKEAEIKAARTALLAVQSSGLVEPNDKPNDYSAYTVIPMKKVTDLGISNQESAAALKPKKAKFKKRKRKNGSDASKRIPTENTGDVEVQMVNQAEPELHENAAVGTQGTDSGPAALAATMDNLVPCNNWSSGEIKTALMVNQNDYGTSNLGINFQYGVGDMTEGNAVTGVGQITSDLDVSSVMCLGDVTSWLEQQPACATDADQGPSTKTEAEIS
ncbi:double-stranded RNA-binding protein 1-like [Lycium ferocissimum]|uniref:double-stranded RNA-binding protein 1-like n=1 Tax=Lycium ferocissimum TaxID=112874 RepID=UPI002814CF62|nr:double-stranded RNA-binding protein 1-like [Lycium ferocissimum]